MSRNNDTARNVHIGANVVSTGLFLWQVGWAASAVSAAHVSHHHCDVCRSIWSRSAGPTLLVVSQVPTGIEIVLKVFANVSWP